MRTHGRDTDPMFSCPMPRAQPRRSSRNALLAAIVVGLAYYYYGGGAAGESAIDGLVFPESVRMSGTTQNLIGGGTRFKYGAVKARPC